MSKDALKNHLRLSAIHYTKVSLNNVARRRVSRMPGNLIKKIAQKRPSYAIHRESLIQNSLHRCRMEARMEAVRKMKQAKKEKHRLQKKIEDFLLRKKLDLASNRSNLILSDEARQKLKSTTSLKIKAVTERSSSLGEYPRVMGDKGRRIFSSSISLLNLRNKRIVYSS